MVILKKIDDISIKDIMILLQTINLSGDVLKGKTRLQKLVFLAQEEFNGNFDYQFHPAQFGPLSYKLNHALQRAKKLDLVKETVGKTPIGNEVFCYNLTSEGTKLLGFGASSKILDMKSRLAIDRTIKKYGKTPFGQLLDYVHDKYPQYKEE